MGRRADLEKKIEILCRIIPQIEVEIEIIDENQDFYADLDAIYIGLDNPDDISSGDIVTKFGDKLESQTQKKDDVSGNLDTNSKKAKEIMEEAYQLLMAYQEELANLGPDD